MKAYASALRSHEAKRLSIIEAASAVFGREGFSGANLDVIAQEAGVSRQTLYNRHGDKEKLFVAVVGELTTRMAAICVEAMTTFPDEPSHLEDDLTAFALRVNRHCICSRDGYLLRRLVQGESARYPHLFTGWEEQGAAKAWDALATGLEGLARAGWLDIEDAHLAARQFLALIRSDLQVYILLGETPDDETLEKASRSAVRTFLRAFVPRG
ncbi:MAG: TetR/AcrR family transcriptional regulator [Alphaproteobacteria bacterium]|jgi:AcrR family transcriptional regulator|nr:TetR/AcrR family transcriptional regulator [Alphaproteobacteria bacterium]